MTSDPRVFFASERTLLAWLRTGTAIIGVGFIVSRFGLFMQLVDAQHAGGMRPAGHAVSGVLGLLFVLLGSVAVGMATLQHARFVATLPERDRPAAYSRHFAIWLAALVSAGGLVLAAYLALSTP